MPTMYAKKMTIKPMKKGAKKKSMKPMKKMSYGKGKK